VRYFNDSAATIPEAAAACVAALGNPVLVCGGSDKKLELSPLVEAARRAKKVILLAGSASDRLASLLHEAGIACDAPYDDLGAACKAAIAAADTGDAVALSPGCASFGMFLNEFDRGRRWKDAVREVF
jgi:UDP-N-acetylmuramoylalanine--D-glutamate ligase